MKQISQFCLLALSLFLWTACKSDSHSEVDLYSAVPQNSAVILESHNLPESIERFSHSRIFQETDSLAVMAELNTRLQSLYGRFNRDSIRDFFDDRKIIMATAMSGADKFDALFLTTADREFEKSMGRKLSQGFTVAKKSYSGAEIYHFRKKDQEGINYHISSYQGVLMLSTNGQLVEEGIRQLNSEFSLGRDPGFARLLKTANKRDMANVYLNLAELGPLVSNISPRAEVDFIERMGSWVELDLQTHDQELLLSGLTLLNEGKGRYLNTFKGLKPQVSRAQEIIPAGTAIWLSLGFANAERYYRNYEEYLEQAGRLRRHQQILAKLDINLRSTLLQWVDNEMGLFGNAGKSGQVNYLAYFAYRNEDAAREKLDSLAGADFIEGYRGVIIKKMAAENALPRLYGPLYQHFHFPYYFIKNGYVVFAESLPVLKGVINDILDGKTLAEDDSYRQFVAKIPDRSHLRVIAANPGFIPLLANIATAEDASVLEQQQESLQNLRWAALQFEVEDEAALTNFYLRHETRKKEMVTRLWSTQLESEAANIPQFLKNHINNKYDLAVQDEDNRLYLLDYNGKVLWTKMLDGPIMGNITQVDGFKNRKLQMVFNTRNKLYLLDRLGRDVENFPVSLPEAATAPVGVFNYDFARNYRLVIPSGKKLLNYDIEGKEVKGWNFEPVGSEIVSQPQHFSVARKDVIVVETADGRLLQLNRRGEQRFETIDNLPRLDIPFYLKEEESLAKSEMISTGDDGKLYAFHPGGTADNLFLEADYPAEHFMFFDGKYIFSSDEKLFVKSDKMPWQAELGGDISSKPKAMILKGKFYTGAFSAAAEEIRLYNEKGELIEGFPVFAQGPFDMGSLKLDGSINIVTYSKDGTLICYRVE